MECYSKLLGVDYPWSKYHQVVVRDYVSGAMENTSATLHGEFLNKTHREMIDGNQEDIVAHELFHQWFGDLVTCESWRKVLLPMVNIYGWSIVRAVMPQTFISGKAAIIILRHIQTVKTVVQLTIIIPIGKKCLMPLAIIREA